MKKNLPFWLHTLAILFTTFSLTACKESDTPKDPADDPTLKIEVTVEPSDNNAIISTTPAEKVGAYILANMTYEEFEITGGTDDPDYFIDTFVKRFINYGGDPTKVDNINVFEGNIDLKLTGLLPSTDYVAIAFSATKDAEITSDITYTKYTTLDYIAPDAELGGVEITNITAQNGTVTINAGSYTGNIFSRLCDKKDYESFYQNDPVKAATSMVENAVAKGVDLSTPDGKYIWKGDASYELEDVYPRLMPDIEYFILTFGVDEQGVITTKIVESAFATPSTDDKITNRAVTVSKITSTSAFIDFAPDVNGATYYATVFEESYLAGLNDEEIIAKLYSEPNFSGSVRDYPVSNTITGLDKGAKYQAIAFGFDEVKGEATTEVFSVIFSTTTSSSTEVTLPTSITLATAEFGEITFSNNADKSFKFNVIPNDKNMKYIVIDSFASDGVYTPDELEGKSDEEIILKDLTIVDLAAKQYDLTFEEALNNEMVSKSGDWSNVYGPKKEGQTYVILAYGIDLTTAQPITKLHRAEYTVPVSE